MFDMDRDSASEGEIVESDQGSKANSTRSSHKDHEIDSKNRPRSPVSRSYEPLRRTAGYHDASRRNPEYGSSSRQSDKERNPGYDSHTYSGRGDPHGPRNGHGHYREDASSRDSRKSHGQQSHRSRADSDNTRRPSGNGRPTLSYEESGYDRSDLNSSHGRRNLDRRSNGHQDFESRSSRRTSDSLYEDSGPERKRVRIHEPVTGSILQPAQAEEPVVDEPPPDEATLIEIRRKKREQLRAKYKDQDSSLLQKALHAPGTPTSTDGDTKDSNVTPLTVSSPGSTQSLGDSPGPESPAQISVTDDQELANPMQETSTPAESGASPSAADYDPSMDMQEDKVREQESLKTQDDLLTTLDDRAAENINASNVDTAAANEETFKAKEFDMFAEDDDDDDMFAVNEDTKGHKKDDGTQAVRIPAAKQLDRSMLDDWDDPEGYYRIILGELLDGRYHVQTNLGKGVFSAVVRATDSVTDKTVAIKVIRKQESMYKAGLREIEILQKLADNDPEDKRHVIRLERHFEHKGHLCMVFENLSINLREVLKKFGRDVGINIKAVRSYAQQMFLGLGLLKKCEILHADLKPDNVLVNESRSFLKIADLGSAVDSHDNEITDVLVSRFYRAPEIMLGMPHDYALDMWSIGCTLFELYTGKICFTGPTNNQMLKVIIECRGKIPNRMLKRSEYWAQHFDVDGTFLSQEVDPLTRKEVVRRMIINRPVQAKELRARLFASAKGIGPAEAKELNLFADLLDKCLDIDPARRITPAEAVKHPFLTRPSVAAKA